MVAAVEHTQTGNKIIAIHRTWLLTDGSGKADLNPAKAALGSIAGGGVRLAPAAETLCLSEGIEDALSVMRATGLPAWAALGTSNLARVELPAFVREVIICADADAAGENGARRAAARILREGRCVRIARPGNAKDFNERLTA